MQLMPSLGQRQKQSLVMTPQLQQAIKLLQMTNLDIKNYLENQVLENPFLEVHSQETLLQSLHLRKILQPLTPHPSQKISPKFNQKFNQ